MASMAHVGILLNLKGAEKATTKMKGFAGATRKAGVTSQSFTSSLSKIGGSFKSVAKLATGAVAAVGAFAAAKGFGDFVSDGFEAVKVAETQSVAFETMLGSAEKAKKMMSDIETMAVATPFDIADLNNAVTQMLAFDFEANKALDTLKTIGNASSGLGKGSEGIESIVRALGQMKSKGVIQAEELNQLLDVGVSAKKILAEAKGISISKLDEMLAKKEITADEGIDLILKGLDSKFGGLMDEQAKTLQGKLDALSEAKALTAKAAIEPFMSFLADNSDMIMSRLDEVKAFFEGKKYKEFSKALIENSLKAMTLVGKVTNKIGESLDKIKNSKAIQATIKFISDGISNIGKTLQSNAMQTQLSSIIEGITGAFSKLKKFGAELWEEFSEGLGVAAPELEDIKNAVMGLVNAITGSEVPAGIGLLGKIGSMLATVLKTTARLLGLVIGGVTRLMTEVTIPLATNIKTTVVPIIVGLIGYVSDLIKLLFERIRTFTKFITVDAPNAIKKWVEDSIRFISNFFDNVSRTTKNTINNIVSAIKSKMAEAKQWLLAPFRAFTNEISRAFNKINSLKEKASSALNFVRNPIGSIAERFSPQARTPVQTRSSTKRSMPTYLGGISTFTPSVGYNSASRVISDKVKKRNEQASLSSVSSVNINVSAIDGQSTEDFFKRNRDLIANQVARANHYQKAYI